MKNNYLNFVIIKYSVQILENINIKYLRPS